MTDHVFSGEIDEMASDPDIAAELRDKRTNWDLRDRIQKLDQDKVLLVKLWLFRDREIQSAKGECKFCTRSVAVTDESKQAFGEDVTLLCLLCWLRAGRPFEENIVAVPTDPA